MGVTVLSGTRYGGKEKKKRDFVYRIAVDR